MIAKQFLLCALLLLIACFDQTFALFKRSPNYGNNYNSHYSHPSNNQYSSNHYNDPNTHQYPHAPPYGYNTPGHQTIPPYHYQPTNYPTHRPTYQHNTHPPPNYQSAYPRQNFSSYQPSNSFPQNPPTYSNNVPYPNNPPTYPNNPPTYPNNPPTYPSQNRTNSLYPHLPAVPQYPSYPGGAVVNSRTSIKNVYNHDDPHRGSNNYQNPQYARNFTNDKPLVSDQFLPAPLTQCGMTLCSNVVNYPTAEIAEVVNQARRMLNAGQVSASFRAKGLSYQHFSTKYSAGTVNQFANSAGSCRERTSTYHPLQGYSSNDRKTYYVVNLSDLRQGLANIACESAFQICTKRDVPASQSRTCRQMYREEQLLVLPYSEQSYRKFNVEQFELKMFHVPTGCACMPST